MNLIFRISLVTAVILIQAHQSFAADVPDIQNSTSRYDGASIYKNGTGELSDNEKRALDLAKKWINKKDLPFIKENGKVVFVYGMTLPTVICSKLYLCEIELQEGEKVSRNGIIFGDDVRWTVASVFSGSDNEKTVHIVVKPLDMDISTTMMISTDRRVYHIKLMSRDKGFMPRVGFAYPSDLQAYYAELEAKEKESKRKKTIPETKEILDQLNFDYKVSGDASWKPLRVYNDGRKTIIQMPETLTSGEAPAFLVVGTGGETQIVNYRLKKDRYVVDQLFEEGVLIAGVGSHQTKITIKKEKK
jgi:type IV secretion system protein VirB9